MLDRYLTLAPFGGNLEGVRAASLAYFGKEPLKLSIAEAALLVALPQSPEARRPDRFREAARAARDRVLERVAARGDHQRRGRGRREARAGPASARAVSRTRRPRGGGSGRRRQAVEDDPPLHRRAAAGEARGARQGRAPRGSVRSSPRRSSSSTTRAARSAPASAPPTSTTPRATARSTCRARRARRARR